VGVKVTEYVVVPTAGLVVEVVHAKLPATEAVPPVSVELASVWPYVKLDAVGQALTVGVAFVTVTLAVPTTAP
jgi:hypothetical protein